SITIKVSLIVIWIILITYALYQNKKLSFSISKNKANTNELD
ncbi:sulfite exporter TauE/SafE family protein, partial [Staphylococcus cohnii]